MPADTATIRGAVLADAGAMARIEVDLFGPDAWSRQQVDDELLRIGESRWYAVAQDETGIVGYAGLFLAVPDADVQTVAVAPAARRRGLGRRLMDCAIEAAWAQGCTRIFLEVRADNDAAIALYTAAGFIRQGRRPRYYRDGVDALTMRLRRSEPAPLREAPDG